MFRGVLSERMELGEVSLELQTIGAGPPLLFLHAGHGVEAQDPLVGLLAQQYRVILPSHPGFGGSTRPPGVDTVDDLAYVYLDLLEAMDLRDVVVVGVSFGGWIAAELATKGCGRIAQLVLIDAVGVKFGDRDTRDILDVYGTHFDEIPAVFFADGAKGLAAFGDFDFPAMTQEEVLRFTRNRESFLLYGWSPTLYNPKLKSRLKRIKVPTLLLWGGDDRVVPPSYGRAYAAAIPGAVYVEVPGVGHYGYLESPGRFAEAIETFGARAAQAA